MFHLIDYIRRRQPCATQYTFVVGQGSVAEDRLPENVTVREVTDTQKDALDQAAGSLSGFIFWRVLKSWLEQLKPDHLIIMDMTWLELPLCIYRLPCTFSGLLIVQYPELAADAASGWKRRCRFLWKELKTGRFLRHARPRKMFLLNGRYSCEYLNRRFGVSCYVPVPDPLPAVVPEPGFELRSQYDIDPDLCIFLFFGSMSARKGVDRLVDAIGRMSEAVAQRVAFIFCGKPEPMYEKQYRDLIGRLRQKRPDICLRVDEKFVSGSRMRAMFEQSDWILMPYSRPEYSSGILILAAAAATPVIGPADGLIGRQIREHVLGWAIADGNLQSSIEKAAVERFHFDEGARRSFVAASEPDRLAGSILEL